METILSRASRLYVVVVIIMAMASCGAPTTDKPTETPSGPVGSWELTWWDDPTAFSDIQITLRVGSDYVSGKSSCNAYYGSLRVDGSTFGLSNFGTTTMQLCVGITADIENTYIRLLGSVDSWSIDGTDLVLSTNGYPTLRYRQSS